MVCYKQKVIRVSECCFLTPGIWRKSNIWRALNSVKLHFGSRVNLHYPPSRFATFPLLRLADINTQHSLSASNPRCCVSLSDKTLYPGTVRNLYLPAKIIIFLPSHCSLRSLSFVGWMSCINHCWTLLKINVELFYSFFKSFFRSYVGNVVGVLDAQGTHYFSDLK